MTKPKKMWVYSPPKPPNPKVPESLKTEVEEKAGELVESVKKSRIKPPPRNPRFCSLSSRLAINHGIPHICNESFEGIQTEVVAADQMRWTR